MKNAFSQKVVWDHFLIGLAWLGTDLVWSRLELFEIRFQIFVKLEDGGDIAATGTVVWR
jgi:hypothetical protein